MDAVLTSALATRTPGRIALVAAVCALLDGALDAAEAFLRDVRRAPDERLAVEAATVEAWLLRARGRAQPAAEHLEHAAARLLVEDRIATEERRRLAHVA
jgi:hypothetical protein